MAVHKIMINGIEYSNVGNIKTNIEREYVYKVRTLDGVLHEKIRYEVLTHTVPFFNLLDGDYDSLKDYVKANKDVDIVCGLPNGAGYDYATYHITIEDEINKGYLNGIYFKNGLTLKLEAVTANA